MRRQKKKFPFFYFCYTTLALTKEPEKLGAIFFMGKMATGHAKW
jgi:hypothetical protein